MPPVSVHSITYWQDASRVAPPAPVTGVLEHAAGDSDPNSPDLTSSDVVAFSSRMIAAARALESRRQDRLFSDLYAELLVRGSEAGKFSIQHEFVCALQA